MNSTYEKFKISKNIKRYTINDRFNIALQKNGLNLNIYKQLKEIYQKCNYYVHPDIYAPIPDIGFKFIEVNELLELDCRLINYCAELFIWYINKKYNLNYVFDYSNLNYTLQLNRNLQIAS